MNRKAFWSAFILIVAVAILLVGGKIYFATDRSMNEMPQPPGPIACTQEAKLCPDGTAVGRTGPNCEFAACPRMASSTPPIASTTANWKTYTNANYGFSLKYPPAWQVSEQGAANSTSSFRSISQIFVQGQGSSTIYSLDIAAITTTSTIPAGEFVQKLLATLQAEDAANAVNGPAPSVAPHFDDQYDATVGIYPGYELYNVFNFDENSEKIYVTNNNEVLVFEFPTNALNPNLIDPMGNNKIAHEILGTLKLSTPAGVFCGGIAAFRCPTGYSCSLQGTFPDAGGHCVVSK